MNTDIRHLLPGSITNIRSAVEGFSGVASLVELSKDVRQQWITELLVAVDYDRLAREDKGIVRQYIQNETGYSRAQTARLIKSGLEEIVDRKMHSAAMGDIDMHSVDALKLFGKKHATLLSRVGVAGVVSALLLFAALGSAPREGLKFLNANLLSSSPQELSADIVPLRTNVNTVQEGVAYPLFTQSEELGFVDGVAVAYEKFASDVPSILEQHVAERRRQRELRLALLGALPASVSDVLLSAAPEQQPVVEYVGTDRTIRLGDATVAQEEGSATQIRGRTTGAQEQRQSIMSDLFKQVNARRNARIVDVPEEQRIDESLYASAPQVRGTSLVASAPSIWDAVGEARDGQVLMMVDGVPQWTFINQSNVQSLSSGYISRRGGGSGRGGGGGGSTGSTGAQGEQGPAGPAGADGAAGPTLGIYDSLGLESTGNLAAGDAGGLSLYNLGLLTSSGNLVIEGDATIHGTLSGNTIGGFNLTDCDDATGSKLLWDATTKTFSCGSDQGGSNAAKPGQGLTLDGSNFFSVNATLTGALINFQSLSGSDIYAANSLRSSGTLIVEGATTLNDEVTFGSGLIINGVTYRFPSSDGSATGKVLATDGAGNLSWTDAASQVYAGQGLSVDGNNYISLSATLTGTSLEIYGTASGRSIHAQDDLTSSGTLVVEGEATFGSGLIINGVTYIFPFGDGAATGKVLKTDGAGNLSWSDDNNSGTTYSAGQGISIDGSNFITLSATLTGTSLEIFGTASGRIIHAQDELRSSGSLVIEGLALFNSAITGGDAVFSGTLSGANVYAAASLSASGTLAIEGSTYIHGTLSGNTITGFNLTDCQGTSNKLVYNATSQRFECAADQTGGSGGGNTGTGALQNFFDNRYVNTSGDTMTGALVINPTTGTLALETVGILSGEIINASTTLTSSGTLVVEGATTLNDEVTFGSGLIINGVTYIFPFGDGAATGKVLKTDGAGNLSWSDDNNSGTTYSAGQGISIDGSNFITLSATLTGTSLEIYGTASGRIIHAQDNLTSSGGLEVAGETLLKGTLSGTTIVGFNLTNCNGSTDKLAYNATTNKFECGTDTDTTAYFSGTGALQNFFDNRFVNTSGDTMTGALLINPTTGTVALEANGVISGTYLHAQDLLTSSGTLIVEGATTLNDEVTFGSGLIINGVTYRFPSSDGASSGKVLATDGAGNLSWTSDASTTYSAGQGLTLDGNNYLRLNATLTGTSLEIYGTASGRIIHAQDNLTSSGTLQIDGEAKIKGTLSGNTIVGFNLTDCNGSANKIVYNAANQRFECETDNTIADTDTHFSGTGALQAFFDNRFVNTSGDTMTGALLINPTTGTVAVEANGVISGTSLHANDILTSSGTLIVEGAATFGSTITINGVTYTFPYGDGSATGKVLKTDGAGNLSWSDDTDTDTTYSAGQGLSLDGSNFLSLNATLTGTSLEIYGTASGRLVHAQDNLTSSGTLQVDGQTEIKGATFLNNEVTFGSGIIINGVTYIFPFGDGSATGKVLKTDGAGNLSWSDDNNSGTTYSAGQGISIDGSNFITLSATLTGTSLEIYGTASGRIVHAQDTLTSSGNLVVEGAIESFGSVTLHGTLTGNTLTGFGLSNCTGGNKLLWNSSTQAFECGVDQSAGTGLDQSSGDARYVNVSGDTMTGALIINPQSTTLAFEAIGIASGRVLHAQDELTSSGNLLVDGNIYVNGDTQYIRFRGTSGGGGQGIVYTTSDGLDRYSLFFPGSNVVALGNRGADGVVQIRANDASAGSAGEHTVAQYEDTEVNFYVIASGSTLHAEDLLSSSGALAVDGDTWLDGEVTFGSGLIINGVTYRFPSSDGASSGKVLATDGAGNLSWTTGGSTVYAGQGLTANGSFISLSATLTGTSLEIYGTASGRIIHAQDNLTSSGGLEVAGETLLKGTLSGTTIVGFNLTNCNGSTDKLAYNATTNKFECGTDTDTTAYFSGTGALQAFFDNRFVNTSGDTMTGALLINPTTGTVALEANGILSGTSLHAQDILTSSGTFVVEGATTLNDEVTFGSGLIINGVTYRFPFGDGSATGKVLKTDGAGNLSWSDDTDTNTTYSAGQGISIDGNSYITLSATLTGTSLEIYGTASGRIIHAQDNLTSSGGLSVAGPARIGTSLDVTGTASASLLHAEGAITSSGSVLIDTLATPSIIGTDKDDTNLAGVLGLDKSGPYVYAVSRTNNSLEIIDTSDPANPVTVGSVQDATNLNGPVAVKVSGKYAYVSCRDGDDFRVIDVSNPSSPVIVGGHEFGATADLTGLDIEGQYAYVPDSNLHKLYIFDLSDPKNPALVSTLTDATNLNGIYDVDAVGKYVYTANYFSDSMAVIDVSDPLHPSIAGYVGDSLNLNGLINIKVYGRYAYVAAYDDLSFRIIDISNPLSPTLKGGIKNTTIFNGIVGIDVAGRYAYVANTGHDSVQIIDITDPNNPVIVGSLQDTTNLNGARSLLVSGKYLYVSARDNNALQILDLGGLETANATIGDLSAGALDVLSSARVYENLVVDGTAKIGDNFIVEGQTTLKSRSGAALRVLGTLSGTNIQAQNTLTSSGTLVVEGATTLNDEVTFGSGIIVNGVTYIFPFGDASASGRVLASDGNGNLSWTAATTDTVLSAGQGLSSDGTFVSLNATLTGTSLEIYGTASGRIVHAQDALTSSGTLIVENATVLNGTLTTAGLSTFQASITGTDAVFSGTVSGSSLYAVTSLNSSGSLNVEGTANIHGTLSGNTIAGFNLTDCSNATNSKLLWDAATQTFSCGSDQGGSNAPQAGQGLSLDGNNFFSLNTTITGSLLEFTTVSGASVRATDLLTSSGQLIVEGATVLNDEVTFGSGLIINGVTYRFPSSDGASSGKVLATDGAGNLSWTTGGSTVYAGQGLSVDGNNFIYLNSVLTGTSLEIYGTASGRHIHAQDLLTSSGQLIVESSLKQGSGAVTVLPAQNQTGAYLFGSGAAILALDSNNQNKSAQPLLSPHILMGYAGTFDTALYRWSGSTLGIRGNLLPEADDTYSLGGTGSRFQHLYVGPNSIHIGTAANEGTISYDAVTDSIILSNNIEVTGTISGATFTNLNSLSSSGNLTIEGTSTFNDEVTFGSGLIINGVTYRFPSSDGASSGKVLATDGAGNLSWTSDANTTYSAGQGLTLDGNNYLRLNATLTGTSLEIYGTASGRIIHAQDNLTSSGGLEVAGETLLKGTLSGTTIVGFNLTNCNGSTDKLAYNATTNKFECGTDTDTTAYFSGTGALQAFFDNRFVNTSGDTMTGALLINPTTGTVALEANGTISGTSLHAQDLLTSSGTLIVEGAATFGSTVTINGVTYTFPYGDGSATGKVLKTDGAGNLSWSDDTDTNTTYDAGQGVSIDGNNFITLSATLTGTSLEIYGTASGRIVHAQDNLTSSGTLQVDGQSEFKGAAIFGSTITVNGVTYTFPFGDGSASGKVLATDGAGNLSWTDGGSTVYAGQGLSVDGNNFIYLNSVLTGTSLEIYGTASGRHIHAQDLLTSSGQLIVESSLKQGSGAVTVLPAESQTGAYLYGSGAAILALDSYEENKSAQPLLSPHILMGYAGTFDTALYRWSGSTLGIRGTLLPETNNIYDLGGTGSRFRDLYLGPNTIHIGAAGDEGTISYDTVTNSIVLSNNIEVTGTISGATFTNLNSLSSSGNLVVEGEATFGSGLIINGVTYRFPSSDGASSGKVLATDGAGNLSWTDGGTTYSAGQGLTLNGSNFLSLNATLTGSLANFTTVSGAVLQAQDRITSSGAIITEDQFIARSSGHGLSVQTLAGTEIVNTNSNGGNGELYVRNSGGSARVLLNSNGDSYFIGGGVGIGATSASEALEVIGTVSGSQVYAADTLRSSGSLVVEGAATFGSTVTINGVTYTFPYGDGSATGKVLKTDGAGNLSWSDDTDTNTTYSAGQGISIDGSNFITLSATLTGTSLEIYGTASGRIIHAQDNLTSSGTLQIDGEAKIKGTLSGNTIVGFNLTDCNGSANKIVYNAANQRFECETDNTIADTDTHFSGTGALQAFFDNRFVNTSGDTMTGALLINPTTGTVAIEANGVISGTSLHANDILTSSGTLIVEGAATFGSTITINGVTYTFPYGDGSATGKVLKTDGAGNLSWSDDTDTDTTYSAGQGISIDGNNFITLSATLTGTSLEIYGTASGRIIHAQDNLTSSGTLQVDGQTEIKGATFLNNEVTFGSGIIINGVTYIFPFGDGSATGKVLKTDGAGNLSWSDDNNSGTTYSAGQGISIDGSNFITLSATLTGTSLEIYGTASGRIVHAQDTLTSSGGLVTEGAAFINGNLDATGTLSGSVLTIMGPDSYFLGNVGIGTSTASDTALEIIGTASGSQIHAQDTLTSSGAIVAEGNLTINGSSAFQGVTATTIIATLIEAPTISGSTIRAQDFLASSGTLVVEGATTLNDEVTFGSGLIINGVTYRFPSSDGASSGKVLATDGAGNLSWTSAGGGSSYYAGQGITLDGSNFLSLNAALTGTSLEIYGSGIFHGGLQIASSGIAFDSGALLQEIGGFNTSINLSNTNLATNGLVRLTKDGNLKNIGSIQGGSMHLSSANSFVSQGNLTTGSGPYSVDIGDLDGDGNADMVVANRGGATVSIFINNGSGTFASKVDYSTGNSPYTVDIGDLNGDGKADIATANQNGNSVSVLINNGDGTFAAKTDYTVGSNPYSVAIRDLDGDGNVDIVAANLSSSTASVLINNGDGTFATKVDYTVGANPYSVAIGDMDGDGSADIVTGNLSGNSVSVLLNNGDGTFAAKVDYDSGASTNPRSVAVGDLNDDGSADIVTGNSSSNVSVLLNNGDGTFATSVKYTAGSSTRVVAIGDLDRDGYADIAVANSTAGSVSVLVNNGDGTFATKVDYATGSAPQSVAIGDLDGDGNADLAVPNSGDDTMTILLNQVTASVDTFGNSGTLITVAGETQTGAYIYGSGAAILALDSYQGTQSGTTAHIMFGYHGIFDTALYRSGNDNGGSGGLVLKTQQTGASQVAFQIITDNGTQNNRVFKVTASGAVHADGAFNATGADYAEWFKSRDTLDEGEVVCIDITHNNTIQRCTREADSNVMGIVSSNPAYIGNKITGAEGIMPPGYELIGLIGQVPTKVLIENHETASGSELLTVRPGDALTPASKPGFARRALPGEPTVGVALEGFSGEEGDEGMVNVLISRRNSSLTVDMVESKVIDQIAAMQIDDEVRMMVANAVDSIELDDEIAQQVRTELDELDINASIQSLLNDWNISAQVVDVIQSLQNASGSIVGSTLTEDQQAQIQQLLSSGSLVWDRYDSLSHRISMVQSEIRTLSGALTGRNGGFDDLTVEQNFTVGGDARAASDLYVDGTLHATDIFVPGLFTLDGSMDIGGSLSAGELVVQSGAVVHGPLSIDGKLMIDGQELDLSGLAGSGGFLNLGNLLVQNALKVLGDITIDGMAEILGDAYVGGDLTVSGSLIINSNQAGYATVVKTGTGVTVRFGSGAFAATPIVTASSDSFTPWRITHTTGTGFTIEVAEPATEDITFMWQAMLTQDPQNVKGLPAGASNSDKPFFVDSKGVPVSSSDIWNACIRNQQPLDVNGDPFNCRRYHDKDMWTHPDYLVQFKWDSEADPDLRLIIPRGYYVEVVQKDDVENRDEPTIQGEDSSSSVDSAASSDSSVSSEESYVSSESTSSASTSEETASGSTIQSSSGSTISESSSSVSSEAVSSESTSSIESSDAATEQSSSSVSSEESSVSSESTSSSEQASSVSSEVSSSVESTASEASSSVSSETVSSESTSSVSSTETTETPAQ